MPRDVLVLGGTGFVGRHVVAKLATAGHRVIVPTRRRERARDVVMLPTVTVVEAASSTNQLLPIARLSVVLDR